MENTKTKRLSTKSMVLCAMFTALVAVGAFIQIPVPYMDYFTLQFFFVLLAGLILGGNKGAISVGCYVWIHIPTEFWLSGRIYCERVCDRKNM